jgi:hypothetical protein
LPRADQLLLTATIEDAAPAIARFVSCQVKSV